MPRERSPNRDKAKQIYLDSDGSMKLKDIAAELGVSDSQIRKWKNQDTWDEALKGNVTNKKGRKKSNVTKPGAPKGNQNAKGHGAPKGNKNAIGNAGGPGGPYRNEKAVKHGLFRKFLPQDPEYMEIFDAAGELNALDMLWSQIQIKFANIIHAQRVMWVESKEELVKEMKKKKTTSFGGEEGGFADETEWEIQFAWDRQATALNAQARAMGQLTSMIRQYEEMLRAEWGDEERKLQLDKLKAEVDKAKAEAKEWTDGGDNAHELGKSYEDALNAQVGDVFADEVKDNAEA